MKLRYTCREVARLVLQRPEQPWSAAERVMVQLHWWACESCSRFRRQDDLMREATARWRAYRDDT